MTLKIATFNANSVRARLPIILDRLEREAPDALFLQETKVQDKDFPAGAFEEAGYRVAYRGQNVLGLPEPQGAREEPGLANRLHPGYPAPCRGLVVRPHRSRGPAS